MSAWHPGSETRSRKFSITAVSTPWSSARTGLKWQRSSASLWYVTSFPHAEMFLYELQRFRGEAGLFPGIVRVQPPDALDAQPFHLLLEVLAEIGVVDVAV